MAKWLYATASGRAVLYQEADQIYDTGGRAVYWESGGWWFQHGTGAGTHYLSGNWVYSADGKPCYYF